MYNVQQKNNVFAELEITLSRVITPHTFFVGGKGLW